MGESYEDIQRKSEKLGDMSFKAMLLGFASGLGAYIGVKSGVSDIGAKEYVEGALEITGGVLAGGVSAGSFIAMLALCYEELENDKQL